jgi:hypothetical protein
MNIREATPIFKTHHHLQQIYTTIEFDFLDTTLITTTNSCKTMFMEDL